MKKADRDLKILKNMPTIILIVTFLILALIVNVQAIVEHSKSLEFDQGIGLVERLHKVD